LASGQADNVKDCKGPFRCALRGLERENLIVFSDKTTDEKLIEANSDTFRSVARARRVTNFPDKVGRGRNPFTAQRGNKAQHKARAPSVIVSGFRRVAIVTSF
jgi:hypothetical protein